MTLSKAELSEFGSILGSLALENVDYCVAILWREAIGSPLATASASELCRTVHELGLTPVLHVNRTLKQLQAHPATHRVTVNGKTHFRIAANRMNELSSTYGPLLKHRPLPDTDSLIEVGTVPSHLGIAVAIVKEMNHAYDSGCYNGCAVLMRRLVEGLLVSAFETANKAAAIMKGADYMTLDAILGVVNTGREIKLSRGKDRVLEEVKTLGDHGAHSRTYLVRKPDIDDVKVKYRTLIAELISKC